MLVPLYVPSRPSGSYFVYALDTTGAHTPRFSGAPTTVVVTAGNTATANASLPAARGTLAGTVTDTGGPVAGVLAIDDHLLIRVLLDDEPAGLRPAQARVFTTGLWYHRACRALASSTVTGALSRLLGAAGPAIGAAALGAVTALPCTYTATGAEPPPKPSWPPRPHRAPQRISPARSPRRRGGNLEGVAVFAARTSDFGLAAGALTDASGNYDGPVGHRHRQMRKGAITWA